MKIGYARVSSATQDLDIQISSLQEYGCTRIYSEKISGKDMERPQLLAMFDILREGDIVVVTRIDRITRSVKGVIELVEKLNNKGAHLVSLDFTDQINTTTPFGEFMLQTNAAFAQLERNLIKARTEEGRKKARERGVKFGKPLGYRSPSTERKLELIEVCLKAKKGYNYIARELNVSKFTISKVKKQLKEGKS